ncbi:signal peptidase I [Stackebrandtia albiflava]|nr:signal peptidase I [Stackebrandtia albiflava]
MNAPRPRDVAPPRRGAAVTVSRLRRIRSHRRRHLPLLVELPLLLLVAFCAAVLLRSFVVQSFDIPSGSMEMTLQVGDRVVVNKLVYALREPQRGEVVVFKGTDRWASEVRMPTDTTLLEDVGRVLGDLIGIAAPDEKDLIKRIIGIPGDTVSCCDDAGRVVVNGVSLDESEYLYDDAALEADPAANDCLSRRFGPVHVPPGHVFVMGDHRGDSKDSRCQGFVPVENFIGRAIAVVWPEDHWRALEIPAAFAAVPPGDADGAPVDTAAGTPNPVVPLIPPLLPLPSRRRRGPETRRIRRDVDESRSVEVDSGGDRRRTRFGRRRQPHRSPCRGQ